jgi:hypothetical protein
MGSGLLCAWAGDIDIAININVNMNRIGDSKADGRRSCGIEAHPLVGGTEYQTRYT